MRLDRFLSGQTALSRRELTELIRGGSATVNGTVVRRPETAVSPERDRITLQGRAVQYSEFHHFLLHKPAGVITASRDPKQKTVLDLLGSADRLPKLAPAGRLDLDTEGLLLITDDGARAHRMISPKHHTAKYYLAQLAEPYDPAYEALFRGGILLREGGSEEQCLPAECMQIGERLAVLELHEGKYHQARRMFAAAGNHVTHLLRFQIGALRLPPDLPAGSYINILNKDADAAFQNSSISDAGRFCARHYSSYWIKDLK